MSKTNTLSAINVR